MRIDFPFGHRAGDSLECQLWHRSYFNNFGLRDACSHCSYASLSRQGDLSLGDFWGIGKSYPEFDFPDGNSLILVNTPTGEQYLEALRPKLEYHAVELRNCMQPSLEKPVVPNCRNREFMNDLTQMDFRQLAKSYLNYTWSERLRYCLAHLRGKWY